MGQQRPFRFGIQVSGASSREAWIATARKAEALGYSTLLVDDHLGNPLAPLPALVTAAEVTTTLRIGTFVLANDFRHPVLLAREAATLDLLSSGRLELGLGTGYALADYTQSGIPLSPPGVRVSRFAEAVQIIKGMFADAPLTFAGRYYSIHDLNGATPIQRPHPPLLIGGGGQRMLSLAAREADIVSVNIKTTPTGGFDFRSLTAEAAAQKVAWVREAAGEHFQALELNLLVPLIAMTNNQRQGAEQLLRHWGIDTEAFSVGQVLESPSALLGSVDQIVDNFNVPQRNWEIFASPEGASSFLQRCGWNALASWLGSSAAIAA
jgi:probable F420-dependent oxidoreductase